jgi:plastocyanin
MKIIFTAFGIIMGGIFMMFRENLRFFKNISEIRMVTFSPVREYGLRQSAPSEGKITGKVFISKSNANIGRSAKGLYGKSASRLAQGGSAERKAVVFIVHAAGYFPLPQTHPAMRQRNIAIVPHVLPVLIGTTVDFPNEDQIYHNIFSLSPTKAFDLGRYSRGLSKSVTFNKIGQVKVFCDIHSQMGGVILVLQNPYFATVGIDGSYTINGVPAGTYDVAVWHENGSTPITQKVTVRGGEPAEANFSF